MPQASMHSPIGTIRVESDGARLAAIRIGGAAPAGEGMVTKRWLLDHERSEG